MKLYMKFGDWKASDWGVILMERPNVPNPGERGEEVIVPGRSGVVWLGEGAFNPIAFTLKLFVPESKGAQLANIRAWLSGEGRLCMEETSLFDYKARVTGTYDFIPFQGGGGWQATVPMTCHPFRYLRNPASQEITAQNTMVENPYTVYAEPRLTLYGSGNVAVTVGGSTFEVANLPTGLVVDTELMDAYIGSNRYNDRMHGGFPVLVSGDNAVSWTGNVTKIVVAPNWRSL